MRIGLRMYFSDAETIEDDGAGRMGVVLAGTKPSCSTARHTDPCRSVIGSSTQDRIVSSMATFNTCTYVSTKLYNSVRSTV